MTFMALLLAGCVPPGGPGGVPGAFAPPNLGGRVLTVAVLPDYLPFSRVDPQTGAVSGWDYDLITALAERLHFEPHFVAVPQAELLADMAAGRYDLAGGGVSFTLERAEVLAFTAPYALTKERVVVRADDARTATIAAFRDAATLVVGTVPDTTEYDAAVAYFGIARVRSYTTFAAALDALAAGALDAAIVSDPDLQAGLAQRPGAFQALPGPLAGDVLAYVLPPDSDLEGPLMLGYLALEFEGELTALREKWGL